MYTSVTQTGADADANQLNQICIVFYCFPDSLLRLIITPLVQSGGTLCPGGPTTRTPRLNSALVRPFTVTAGPIRDTG